MKLHHPLAAERARHRRRLRDRTKPDFCYSDEENEKADVPHYSGPYHETRLDSITVDNTDTVEDIIDSLEVAEVEVEYKRYRLSNTTGRTYGSK